MISFESGEKVRIKDGVFANFPAVIAQVNAERRILTVSLTVLSRGLAMELGFTQVEKMA